MRAAAFHPSANVAVVIHDNVVYRSTDSGETWTPLETAGMERPTVVALLIPDNDPDTIFAATQGRGVFVYSLPGDRSFSTAGQSPAAPAAGGITVRSNQP